MTFHFEWHSILNNIQFFLTFCFEWHSMLSDIKFLINFYFEWYSILSDISFWVTFHYEWYSVFSDIPFWVTIFTRWEIQCPLFSDNPCWFSTAAIFGQFPANFIFSGALVIGYKIGFASKYRIYISLIVIGHLQCPPVSNIRLAWLREATHAKRQSSCRHWT